MIEKYTNRLISETSPYLIQHAHNPVNWFPWNQQALDKAKNENKLILLSIGYSACHWCHVMADESFANPEIAKLMNQLFVNIKVDREERPDLDKIYQTAHQMLNQRAGGWPLTVILTPDTQIPFFAGTYFPNTAKQGMPGITEILNNVEQFYQKNRDKISKQSTNIQETFSNLNNKVICQTTEIQTFVLDEARKQLADMFDEVYAGFGKAPKFPHPSNIERLIRHWQISVNNNNQDKFAHKMVFLTLNAMASGGIFDQLAGGFFRYSVDNFWTIPHFEKMLYDNGLLLAIYAQASHLFKNKTFSRISNETAVWVIKTMQSPNGAYYSSLDADTNHVEGKTYCWDTKQIKEILSTEEYQYFSAVYGLLNKPNFENSWHLNITHNITELATEQNISEQHIINNIDSAKLKLLAIRDQRPQPARDEKILTSWNALMIKGMMLSGKLLKNKSYIDSAQGAIDFIRLNMYQNGRLLASYKDNKSHLMAYLDDYAYMLDALLQSLQSQWRTIDFSFAIELADCLLEFFNDNEYGGFFFTAHDHEKLIQRPKDYSDDAIPSGNAIACICLARLGHLVANTQYIDASVKCIQNAWSSVSQYPAAHGAMLNAIEEYLYPTSLVIITGSKSSKKSEFNELCTEFYQAKILCFNIPTKTNENNTTYSALSVFDKYQSEKDCIAHICIGTSCTPAITNIKDLKEKLITPI